MCSCRTRSVLGHRLFSIIFYQHNKLYRTSHVFSWFSPLTNWLVFTATDTIFFSVYRRPEATDKISMPKVGFSHHIGLFQLLKVRHLVPFMRLQYICWPAATPEKWRSPMCPASCPSAAPAQDVTNVIGHLLWLDSWTELSVPFIQTSLPRGCLTLQVSKCLWSSSSTQPAMLSACPCLSGSRHQAEKHAKSFEVSLPCTLPKLCSSQVVITGKTFLMNLSYCGCSTHPCGRDMGRMRFST